MLGQSKGSYHAITNVHRCFRKYKSLIAGIGAARPEWVGVSDIAIYGYQIQPYIVYLSLVAGAYFMKILGFDFIRWGYECT